MATVLYVGRAMQAEFQEAVAALEHSAALVRVEDLEQACDLLTAGHFDPELIVVEQARPGEPEHLARLAGAAPLAGIWVLSGSWGDGEERTGRRWPLAERIAWQNFGARWAAEQQRFERGHRPSWQEPATWTPEERLLREATPVEWSVQGAPRGVAIFSEDRATAEWLLDAARAAGAEACWSRWTQPVRASDAHLALLDLDELDASVRAAWPRIRAATPLARRIVLMGFPRWHDRADALALGADDLLGKPLPLAAFERLISMAGQIAQ